MSQSENYTGEKILNKNCAVKTSLHFIKLPFIHGFLYITKYTHKLKFYIQQ